MGSTMLVYTKHRAWVPPNVGCAAFSHPQMQYKGTIIVDKETYLGDAVYASCNGYQIWLRTGDGNDQRIALDPETFQALVAYERKLRQSGKKQDNGP